MEVVTDYLFLGSKIIVDSDHSHEIRRQLLLGRKAMTNLDNMLKSRVCIIKAIIFPVVMYSLRAEPLRGQSTKELMPLNCDAGEDSWKSLRQQGDQANQS